MRNDTTERRWSDFEHCQPQCRVFYVELDLQHSIVCIQQVLLKLIWMESKGYERFVKLKLNIHSLLQNCISSVQFSSVQSLSRARHARPPCPSPTSGVHSDSRPSSQWCHPAISSSVVLFSSCLQSLPASKSFPITQLFAWGGQSIGVSALASFLPKNTYGWSPLEWTGWISLQSKGLARVFSNTTGQKHQFFGAQLSSQSNSHIHT